MDKELFVKMVTELSKQAADKGRAIELGWLGLRLAAYNPSLPEDTVATYREAFFAGASHLFSTMVTVMDSDREPTLQDLRRVELIQHELEEFNEEFKFNHNLKEPR